MPTRAIPIALFVPNPSAPTVTPQGTTGATNYSYVIVGIAVDGSHSAASSAGSTASGNATLSSSNKNHLTWTDPLNAVSINIYRTVGGGSLGLIGSVAAGVQAFDDTGLAGDASTAPATNTTGVGVPVGVDEIDDLNIQVDGTFVATVQIQGIIDGCSTWQNIGSAQTAPGMVAAATAFYSKLRAKMTAFTSGSPLIFVGGHKRPA